MLETADKQKPAADAVKAAPAVTSKVQKTGFISFAEIVARSYKIAALAIIVLAVGLIAMFSFQIYKAGVADIKAKIAEKQKQLAEKESEKESIQTALENIASAEIIATKIISALPPERDLASVYVQLEAMAYKNNLFLSNVEVSEDIDKKEAESRKTRLRKLTLNLSLSGGDYFAFKNFLADLEKNLRLMDVQSFVYAPETGTYNLIANTYYFGAGYGGVGK